MQAELYSGIIKVRPMSLLLFLLLLLLLLLLKCKD